jgi:hypothetical protein
MRSISILFAGLLAFAAGMDLRHTREAWSWQPRHVRIARSSVEPTSDGKSHFLRIDVWDIEDKRSIRHVKIRYGPQGFIYHWPWHEYHSTDEDTYPVGREMIAYRNPENHDKYILEQTNLSWIAITLGTVSVAWIGWNVLRKVRSVQKDGAADAVETPAIG